MEKNNRSPLKNPLKGWFDQEWMLRQLPFFLFLSLLAILYIANGHYADQVIRKINLTQSEITELQFNYKTLKSELMFKSGEEQMIQAATPLQLKVNDELPYRLSTPKKN
ncbi:MAG: FtsL-like putative cell division protein [Sediminibacterium sp.]